MVPRPLTGFEVEVLSLANALAGEAGELSNAIKKCFRDGTTPLSSEILLELGDIEHYTVRLILTLGSNLDEIRRMNVTKIESRRANRKLV